jgi:hypothetical protein
MNIQWIDSALRGSASDRARFGALSFAGALFLTLPSASEPDIIAATRRGRLSCHGQQHSMNKDLSDEERAEFAREVERLREEHRDLDAAIEALNAVGANDQLQLQRLKKRKLSLRDRISFLEDALTPDIIA